MFKPDGKKKMPKLPGKGAEVKDLVPALLHVWKELSDHSCFQHQLVENMLQAQCVLQGILSEHKDSMRLPADACSNMVKYTDVVLVCYSQLANWADQHGHALFNIVPKHHYIWHMARQAKWLNPRKTNTMVDETFMGIVKDIVRACAHGSPCHTTQMSFVEKYRRALHFFFNYGNEWEHAY